MQAAAPIDRLSGIRYVRAEGDVRNLDSLAAGMAGCDATLHLAAPGAWEQDDPVMLVRVQKDFPATGEILAPYAIGPYVAGGMRGSHQMPLMPVPLQSGISYFDGPPVITCAAFAMLLRTAILVFGRKYLERPRYSAELYFEPSKCCERNPL